MSANRRSEEGSQHAGGEEAGDHEGGVGLEGGADRRVTVCLVVVLRRAAARPVVAEGWDARRREFDSCGGGLLSNLTRTDHDLDADGGNAVDDDEDDCRKRGGDMLVSMRAMYGRGNEAYERGREGTWRRWAASG